MEKKIIDLVSKSVTAGGVVISRDTNLEEIGWDSLAVLEFMSACDSELGVNLDSDVLRGASTVGDLIEAVESFG
jgi:acyl carrier protein